MTALLPMTLLPLAAIACWLAVGYVLLSEGRADD